VDNNFLPSEFKGAFKDQMSGLIQFVKDNPVEVVKKMCADEAKDKADDGNTQVIEIQVQPASLSCDDDDEENDTKEVDAYGDDSKRTPNKVDEKVSSCLYCTHPSFN
jgi:hypothetical protein